MDLVFTHQIFGASHAVVDSGLVSSILAVLVESRLSVSHSLDAQHLEHLGTTKSAGFLVNTGQAQERHPRAFIGRTVRDHPSAWPGNGRRQE